MHADGHLDRSVAGLLLDVDRAHPRGDEQGAKRVPQAAVGGGSGVVPGEVRLKETRGF